jgi:hypothetical protein
VDRVWKDYKLNKEGLFSTEINSRVRGCRI